MSNSDCLRNAKNAKNDEFYTMLTDLEYELTRPDYAKHFEGKTVYCNCDNPEWSNFFVFFKLHFKQLKMKKLITTHHNKDNTPSYKIEWCGEMLNDDMVNLIKTPLKGNGDFRSVECIEILKEADIIVTNPPFSIAREYYIPLLQEYNKKFIIIGDINWVAYKNIFPLFKENKLYFGYTNVKNFLTPDGSIQKFGNKTWFTNLDLDKSHEPLILTKNYYGNESRYPKYDNYDAIECSKVKDIPKDYFPCWYDCPHSSTCEYAKTEGKEKDKALCEMARNGEIGDQNKKKFKTPKSVQPACFSQDVRNAMESLACQSPSSQTSVMSSLELSDSTDTQYRKNCSSVGVPELTEFQNTQESSFKNCKKCNGEIGVPITYMSKHCEEQFEILGSDNDFAKNMKDIAEEGTYEKGGPSFYLNNDLAPGRFYVKKNYKYQRLYSRLIIRRKRTV